MSFVINDSESTLRPGNNSNVSVCPDAYSSLCEGSGSETRLGPRSPFEVTEPFSHWGMNSLCGKVGAGMMSLA